MFITANDEDEGSELPGGGLRDKVSLYKGDITVLELDAIVNAGKNLPFDLLGAVCSLEAIKLPFATLYC